VNNAGIIKRVPALEMDPEDFRKVIDMDLVSPFIVSQRVAKTMVERGGGKIINICSMMSELGRDTLSAYASAKGGLKMLTRNLATEWAKYNIQVNGIGPGYFATEQTAPLRVPGNALNEFIISRTPAGKWGDPDDLAGAVIFLSSKSSDFVNGQILYVDGGILATIGKPRG
jgi:gluconate 5-dehydrogenase